MNPKTHQHPSIRPARTGLVAFLGGGTRDSRAAILRSAAVLLVVWAATPLTAAAQMSLELNEVSQFYNMVLYHRYHKAIDRPVQSACYVDFKVAGSLGCTVSTGPKGFDGFKLRQTAKREATKQCKRLGGKRCKLFWRNGELKTDRLSVEALERLQALLDYPGSHETEAAPLPDGTQVGQLVRDSFEGTKNELEAYRSSQEDTYVAICANTAGYWSAFGSQGEGVQSSHVRNLCAVRCSGMAGWLANEYPMFAGKCYVMYTDGKFASEAAERALMK